MTEDIHTSIKLHKRGWKSVYYSKSLAFGLAPASAIPFLKQRLRWGQGAMQVWRQEGILGSVFEGTYPATARGIASSGISRGSGKARSSQSMIARLWMIVSPPATSIGTKPCARTSWRRRAWPLRP